MNLDALADVSASPLNAFPVVADLTTYPKWLGIVRTVEDVDAHPDDPGPAWAVELGARVGPFWRTKTVRMVRTMCESPLRVRFDRDEQDGRAHSPWVLDVAVAQRPSGSRIAVHLHYGGSAWVSLLEPMLRTEANRAGRRLARILA